jgi:hypothetical protein
MARTFEEAADLVRTYPITYTHVVDLIDGKLTNRCQRCGEHTSLAPPCTPMPSISGAVASRVYMDVGWPDDPPWA